MTTKLTHTQTASILQTFNGLFPLLDSNSDTDSCTMQELSIGSDLDSDPQIEMYVVGMEISPWDRDLNRSSSQWKHVLHNTM